MKKLTLFLTATVLVLATLLSACGSTPAKTTVTREAEPTAEAETKTAEEKDDVTVRLMALQGPTGLGLASLLHRVKNGEELGVNLDATIVSSAEISNIAAAIANGSCDIAAVPINLAAQLYKKTNGGVKILCANTLGVLSLLENAGRNVTKIEDLKGKTLYATGQGATPEFILRGLLKKAGIENDVTVEFVADHAELAAKLSVGSKALIGMLPEPNVSVVLASNPDMKVSLDVTEEWNKAFGVPLVQGVYIVRTAFLEEHPLAVSAFMEAYDDSQKAVNADPAAAAEYVIENEILPIPKAAIIAKAIPGCHITYLDGEEMKESVSACLQALFEVAPASIGGEIPADAIYFIAP